MKTMTVRQKTVSTNTNCKGITLLAKTNKYQAKFNYGDTRQYIGTFDTLGEAVAARTKFIVGLI